MASKTLRLGLVLATLALVALAGCSYQTTSTQEKTTNCDLGGCTTTSKGSPLPTVPVIGLVVLASAAVARRVLRSSS